MFLKPMYGKRVLLGVFSILIVSLSAGAASTPETPEAAFHQAFPQVKIDRFRETDMKGVYEVISGQNIFYYFREYDYVFSGAIINKQGTNLTVESFGKFMAEKARNLPLDKAVKIGEGKKVVIEITDPDCEFCRKASRYLAERTDLTRYIFFAPLAHPGAIGKVQYILGAADKKKAYEDMMGGKVIPPDVPAASDEVKALAQEHLSLAKKMGVGATPTFFIDGQAVIGADIAKITRLLQE